MFFISDDDTRDSAKIIQQIMDAESTGDCIVKSPLAKIKVITRQIKPEPIVVNGDVYHPSALGSPTAPTSDKSSNSIKKKHYKIIVKMKKQ